MSRIEHSKVRTNKTGRASRQDASTVEYSRLDRQSNPSRQGTFTNNASKEIQAPSTSGGVSASTPSTSKSRPSSRSTDRSSSTKRGGSTSTAPNASTTDITSEKRRSSKGSEFASSTGSGISYTAEPPTGRRVTYVKETGEATFHIRDGDGGGGGAVRTTSRTTIIFDNKEADVEHTTEIPIAVFLSNPVTSKVVPSLKPEPEVPPRPVKALSETKVPAAEYQTPESSKSDSELTINIRVVYRNSQGSETSLTSVVHARVPADEKSNMKEHVKTAIRKEPPKPTSDVMLPRKRMPNKSNTSELKDDLPKSKLRSTEPNYSTATVRRPEAEDEQESIGPLKVPQSSSDSARRTKTASLPYIRETTNISSTTDSIRKTTPSQYLVAKGKKQLNVPAKTTRDKYGSRLASAVDIEKMNGQSTSTVTRRKGVDS